MGLDGVEIVMAIEREFAIELPDAALAGVATLGELEALVTGRMNSVDQAVMAGVHERLLDIIVHQTGIARHRLVPGARIPRDLDLG